MSEQFQWGEGPGHGVFEGEWTLAEVVAFVQRVADALKQISALLNFAASEQALSPLQRQHEITDELATVQAAIWKVENPTWTIAPSNAWVAANVDSYIAQAGHTPLMPVGVMKAIYANNYSTQAFAFGGGVPEPATWGLMIVGFGAIGAVLRRRRAAAALA